MTCDNRSTFITILEKGLEPNCHPLGPGDIYIYIPKVPKVRKVYSTHTITYIYIYRYIAIYSEFLIYTYKVHIYNIYIYIHP